MKKINKFSEPRELAEHRNTPGADFSSMQKKAVRGSLFAEQGHLCCYCMGRIKSGDGLHKRSKIEHWQPVSKFPERQLEYANLLLACSGGSPSEQHCDAKKADKELKYNPAIHDVESLVYYTRAGDIRSSDKEFDMQLDEVLNLNAALLRYNRGAVYTSVSRSIQRAGSGSVSKATLNRLLSAWQNMDNEGGYQAYAMVAVYYLRKRLRQLEKRGA